MPSHSRSLKSRFENLTRKQLGIIGAVALVVIGGVVAGVVATGGKTPSALHGSTTTSTQAVTSTSVLPADICPLTDTKAPSGAAPNRPALLVKIGNEPGPARPQSGLNEADIVFDTPAEGFIMRYMAVYQCNSASAIGPTRSVRWVDYHLARMFVDPILAFAGGINPNVDAVLSDKWIFPADLIAAQANVAYRTTNRTPPDNLYTSTQQLYSLYKTRTDKPPQVFDYSTSLPAGMQPASSAAIDFSGGTDVVWKWDASSGLWLHTYSGSPDIDTLTGKQVSTTNIVIMSVAYKIGPHIESTGGSGDIESNTLNEGKGYVLRDGHSIAVTWHRKDLLAGFTYTSASGAPVDLSPGRTWVEIVPDTVYNTAGNVTISS